jgi:hypothetical protein
MAPALVLASAGNTAFFVVFGIFVAAMLVLVAITILWAVRHDVDGFKAWRTRQAERGGYPPEQTDGAP